MSPDLHVLSRSYLTASLVSPDHILPLALFLSGKNNKATLIPLEVLPQLILLHSCILVHALHGFAGNVVD